MKNRLDELFINILVEIIKQYIETQEKNIKTTYASSLKETQDILADTYIRYGKNDTINYTEMNKYNRLQALENALIDTLKELGTSNVKAMDKTLKTTYKESYYRSAYILDVAGVKVSFMKLPTRTINEILKFPWSGDTYSNRLYSNTNRLAQTCKEALIRGMIQGHSIQNMSRELNKRFNTGKYNAERILRTESMYFANKGKEKLFRDSGFKKVQYLATLDKRTCEDCGKYDMEIYHLGEEPTLPLHPNCRCTYIPYFEVSHPGERIAKGDDGYYYVSGDMSYKEWLKKNKITL